MKQLFFMLVCLMAAANVNAKDVDSLYAKDLLPIGTEAPLIPHDNSLSKDFNTKGHYTVLDFWATWCPDCRRDIPVMKDIVKEFRSSRIHFMGVSFDTDSATLNRFTEKNEIQWAQYCEYRKWKETQISKDFNIKWIPTYYILDPDRKVCFTTVDINRLRKKLEEIGKNAD